MNSAICKIVAARSSFSAASAVLIPGGVPRVRCKALVLLAAYLGAAMAPSAYASNYNFLAHTVLAKLTPEDIKIGTAAAVGALDTGVSGDWTNPHSGASGKITIIESLDIGGHKGCRKARLDIESGKQKDHGTYVLCKRASGNWAFYSVSTDNANR